MAFVNRARPSSSCNVAIKAKNSKPRWVPILPQPPEKNTASWRAMFAQRRPMLTAITINVVNTQKW